ncbi:peptide/nickel transport system permease protein [Anaerotaenia torta]|uniref:ABC transporter permease n=1 Tax=Anaerotaenia torta TaxID=433293 RepID=UPI003D1C60A7
MKKDERKEHISTSTALDDEQRIKVLSPGMLVAKRFFRNRLAVIGLVIILVMFVFSFIGGLLMPYKESQVFRVEEAVEKDYAGLAVNVDYQYVDADGTSFPPVAKAQLILAINRNEESFVAKDIMYSIVKEGDEFYRIVEYDDFATVRSLKGVDRFTAEGSAEVTKEMQSAYRAAVDAGETSFQLDGTTYYINNNGKNTSIAIAKDISLVSKLIFHSYSQDTALDYAFRLEAERAIDAKASSFSVNGSIYTMEYDAEDNSAIFYLMNGNEKTAYAMASTMTINAVVDEFLTIEFKDAATEAVANGDSSFILPDQSGNEVEYKVVRKDNQYIIRKYTVTQLNNIYEAPSKAHPVGTDGNGMDILTRLMYGGRVSLMLGFAVVFIETFLGVIMGGIAGYFGKWVDTLIMRIVDIMYCIPSMPLYIIMGSIMDYMKIDPMQRLYMLMLILGLLGWPSIARMVRGQILSLREQEFMIATEALGISVPKRIFKHLVPNVIPQLTVIATMSLGSIILTEATLSFLGLGVKFPLASWGNIINAVNNIHVMKSYLFVWMPAGFLILITVLGFNFIGDGLRDAFDPKMKR